MDNSEVVFLRAQLSKLEAQLEKSRELAMEEKQNARNLRVELYKVGKQMTCRYENF